MSVEIWLAFTLASATVLAIPGPTVMLVISYALGKGRNTMWATVPGVTLGDFTAMTASLLGAGAVLAASAELFMALKLIGGGYLIWLGIGLWRSKGEVSDIPEKTKARGYWSIFRSSYLVTTLNPKSIIFFVAFVPQFVNTEAVLLTQFVILEATFLTLAAVNVGIWGYVAGAFRIRFATPHFMRIVNRIGGSFLIAAGLLTASLRKTA